MNIIGINAYHGDASASLVVDGQLVAAVEEERFNRIKHWAGFPAQSIQYCLEVAGISISDVDHVAISFDPRANLARRLAFVASHRPSARAILDRVKRQGKTLGLEDQLARGLGVDRSTVRAQFHRIEHHQTHVSAGFLLSPFEEAAVLSVDGMGDFTSTMTAHAKGTGWREFDRVWFPHSIGFLYSTITMFLGFPYYGDEYKVMGLAPYGEPEFADSIRKMIRPKRDTFELNLEYFTHQKTGVKMKWNDGAPIIEPFHSQKLIAELGPMRARDEPMTSRHDNIAKSLQVVTEEIILHMLTRLHAKTQCENLCMTGGVAMNSVANGKITSQTPFKHVYIPAGAADNGTAFGAAFYVWNKVLGNPRSFVQDHAYWGCESTDDECANAIRTAELPFDCVDQADLVDQTTNLMLDGKVVGWFQGRMEFGARALGSRSLIADPRRTDMRDIINLRIKYREKFRPFAPSILEEHAGEWFEINEPTPYMEKVFPIRREKRELIPAVTHVDGSGRLQTVSKSTNPLYHALITRFYEKTGVPIVLNTSLNENEPVVRTPAEAISCFLRTDMDALVLGNCIIDRHRADFPEAFQKKSSIDRQVKPG
ncbi:carbamoyltransferase family protein [Allorhodopirellula heiligendammensis]|uniref:Decarbamoylnovobiocin carbamoyltransferase n=1 Tax=Allorhodopirellula heiligendammensis TaxID=2714739 RepID=A0A5C6BYN2_9BACT|nr:carbamoyltransferase C-terminal domain-containing protein [Allorhodopirellula heiligendammensis]TWU16998.1 Decarbamoylnovobiocin carbamoyltransferase [Allorhodopirellula heiligendammensis]